MYLIRLDDASEHWNKDNWYRMHNLLEKYDIKPIIAIIPHNEDQKLRKFPKDNDYYDYIKRWVNAEGATPALHGYSHVFTSSDAGINPLNYKSEFAGIPLLEQREKIKKGLDSLVDIGIKPVMFSAPAHTYDWNTLQALREETDINIICDTFATKPYYEKGFYYIPQQVGEVRRLPFNLVTFCYHPNNMINKSFTTLERFIKKNKREFICYNDLVLRKDDLSLSDKVLRWGYFAKRKLFHQGEHIV